MTLDNHKDTKTTKADKPEESLLIKIRRALAKVGIVSVVLFFIVLIPYLHKGLLTTGYAVSLMVFISITIISAVISLVIMVIIDNTKQKIGALIALGIIIFYTYHLLPMFDEWWRAIIKGFTL